VPIIDAKQSPSDAWIESLRKRFPSERLVDETLTRKMRLRSGPPHRPQQVDSVKERLERFLAKRLDGDFTVSEVRGLAGGSSKEQFAFRLQWRDDDGKDCDEMLALRMRPAESVVETHPLREYQALAAVRDVIPVPRLYWIDSNGEELGQPALIYGFCEGINKPPREGAYNPRGGFGAKYREMLAPQFMRYFAELATFDLSTADMSAFDMPKIGSNEGVLKQINAWDRVWEEDSVEAFPLMTLAAQWLRENAPPIDHVSLVHQDYRGGNFLFDPVTGKITAVLDWELVFLGDRHADLAYFMSPLFGEFDPDTGKTFLGGLIDQDVFLAEYERLTGLPVDQKRLDYYHVFSCWRAGINSLATAARVMMGEKTHQDIRVGWILGTAPLVLSGMQQALKGKI
jgi:aminoglycoside phosphotransferase (APT) family kinase protein